MSFEFLVENLEHVSTETLMKITYQFSVSMKKSRKILLNQFEEQKIESFNYFASRTKLKHMNISFFEKFFVIFTNKLKELKSEDFVSLFRFLKISGFKSKAFKEYFLELIEIYAEKMESEKDNEKKTRQNNELFAILTQMRLPENVVLLFK